MSVFTPLQQICSSFDGSNLGQIIGEDSRNLPGDVLAGIISETVHVRKSAATAAGEDPGYYSTISNLPRMGTANQIRYGSARGIFCAKHAGRGAAWVEGVAKSISSPAPSAAVQTPRAVAPVIVPVPASAVAAVSAPVAAPHEPKEKPGLFGKARAAAEFEAQFQPTGTKGHEVGKSSESGLTGRARAAAAFNKQFQGGHRPGA